MRRFAVLPLLLFAFILPACASRPPLPAVQHVILFQLTDPSEARELSGDAFQLMQTPVQALITGPVIHAPEEPAGPERIDVGITAMFNTVEDYRAFVKHPATIAFMSRWRARSTLIRTATYGPTCEPEQSIDNPAGTP